jgi:hypothetical protein
MLMTATTRVAVSSDRPVGRRSRVKPTGAGPSSGTFTETEHRVLQIKPCFDIFASIKQRNRLLRAVNVQPTTFTAMIVVYCLHVNCLRSYTQ